ncbi:MAG: hypothetical protein WCI71_03145 [Bacteroidota bacterium]
MQLKKKTSGLPRGIGTEGTVFHDGEFKPGRKHREISLFVVTFRVITAFKGYPVETNLEFCSDICYIQDPGGLENVWVISSDETEWSPAIPHQAA